MAQNAPKAPPPPPEHFVASAIGMDLRMGVCIHAEKVCNSSNSRD